MSVRNELETITMEMLEAIREEMLKNFENWKSERLKELEPIICKLECLEKSANVLKALQTDLDKLNDLTKTMNKIRCDDVK